jgi:hypothetical protein
LELHRACSTDPIVNQIVDALPQAGPGYIAPGTSKEKSK